VTSTFAPTHPQPDPWARKPGPEHGPAASGATLERALKLLERRPLSTLELRILLALTDGEVGASELADDLDRPRPDVLRAAERLYAGDLLRWRHDRRRDEPRLAITRGGRTTVRPLLAAAVDRLQRPRRLARRVAA
jgi:DNA-binding MarR family transcriptional regulator